MPINKLASGAFDHQAVRERMGHTRLEIAAGNRATEFVLMLHQLDCQHRPVGYSIFPAPARWLSKFVRRYAKLLLIKSKAASLANPRDFPDWVSCSERMAPSISMESCWPSVSGDLALASFARSVR